MQHAPTLAIIGAGASGLMAASEAQRQGIVCTVFDKARRAGGRMASRRSDWGPFNHGAPFISMPASPTDARLQRALSLGASTLRLTDISGEIRSSLVPAETVNALAQRWTQGLTCHFQHTLIALKHDGQSWWLQFSEQAEWRGPFDRVLLTCPPPQALALLSKLPSQYRLCQTLQAMHHAPAWSVRWVPSEPSSVDAGDFLRDDLRADGIALCIREDRRPQGTGTPRYTLHASAEWSAEHLEDSPETAAHALMEIAAKALRIPARAEYLEAHRWRYAWVSQAAGEAFLRGADGLFYAGDACLGATVADALHSGLAAADALCAELALTA